MQNILYMVKTQREWYQVRLVFNHAVLSAGDSVERLLNSVHGMVLRYRNERGFMRAYNGMLYPHVPKEGELIRRQYEYEHRDTELNDLLDGVVSEALKEVRQDTPMKRVLKVHKRSGREVPAVEPPKEEQNTKPVGGKKKILLPKKRSGVRLSI